MKEKALKGKVLIYVDIGLKNWWDITKCMHTRLGKGYNNGQLSP